jgi:aerobic-type carbon monoxide dehydrogenase small subunit (CoxS/CutS family)
VKQDIELKVNGQIYEVEVQPWRTLLEVLRDQLSLTGTKQSCGEGHCGACTVIVDGQAVNSCLMLALEARGKDPNNRSSFQGPAPSDTGGVCDSWCRPMRFLQRG